jgi:crossover junction endodeoxyribonuclease RusA
MGLATQLADALAEIAALQAEVQRLTCLVGQSAASERDGQALTLPYPPTVNTYWRSRWTGKFIQHYISEDGQTFRHQVIRSLTDWDMILGPLSVRIFAYPPDRKARDIDNILKAPLDAMAHAGVFEDDSQIEELYVRKWREPSPPGRIDITVSQLAAEWQPELI